MGIRSQVIEEKSDIDYECHSEMRSSQESKTRAIIIFDLLIPWNGLPPNTVPEKCSIKCPRALLSRKKAK
jgi:hypothetical protein